ncbi:MAG TPA: phosphoribosylglycinamide formyltransferase [Candidatus Polarisedimenticolaceae bacterium]|nr:phosphoribosylglycinamide formyltransferase [Candidatus Polarisedimenticolaceae bacterium]
MPDRPRVGILISGRGSNMAALVDAMQSGRVPADPAVVVSNVPAAAGLAFAKLHGVPTAVVDHTAVKPRAAHEREVIDVLKKHGATIVCLAGYMRFLSPVLVRAFPQRILNIHPALLPAFPGQGAQKQALDHGAKVSGCTVHLVDEELDHGPIVLQAAVPILEDDTVDALSARILVQEHKLYPQALALLAENRLAVWGRRVTIRP